MVTMAIDDIMVHYDDIIESIVMSHIWFQQDGARAHTAKESVSLLQRSFPRRPISLETDRPYPACSLDLTSLDFSLWGYLKDKVSIPPPKSLSDLKERITEEVQQIDMATLQRVTHSVIKRAKLVVEKKGGLIEIK